GWNCAEDRGRYSTNCSSGIRPLAGLFPGRFRQLKKKRLQPAQVKLQWSIIFFLGAPRLLKFTVSFRPALFSIKDHAAPERVPAGNVFRLGLRAQEKRLIDFKPIMRIQSAHKINRTRDHCLSNAIERERVDQGL